MSPTFRSCHLNSLLVRVIQCHANEFTYIWDFSIREKFNWIRKLDPIHSCDHLTNEWRMSILANCLFPFSLFLFQFFFLCFIFFLAVVVIVFFFSLARKIRGTICLHSGLSDSYWSLVLLLLLGARLSHKRISCV